MVPTPRCLLLFALGLPVAIVPAVADPRLWTLWLAYLGCALLAAGVDAVLGLPAQRLRIEIEAPETLFIGVRAPLQLRLSATDWGFATTLELLCDLHLDLEPQPPIQLELPAHGAVDSAVPLVPRRRGIVSVDELWLRWSGPLGLVRRTLRRRLDRSISVLPNVPAVRNAAIQFFGRQAFLSGLKAEHYVGDGSEFESLREYVPGLDHRAMHWKASARHHKLVCRRFRAERNHQIVIAIDTGHLMREPLGGIPKLDHAINAGLLLSYFSLRAGDRVGLFGFDSEVRLFISPEGGMAAFHSIRSRSAELAYSSAETNFTLGLAGLSSRLRRRTLVVLLTDFVDTITADLMLDNLDRLSRRHLVVFVTLRDASLETGMRERFETIGELYQSVVTNDFVREREIVLRRLRERGIHCLDAPPESVSSGLINRYLEIKRRELL